VGNWGLSRRNESTKQCLAEDRRPHSEGTHGFLWVRSRDEPHHDAGKLSTALVGDERKLGSTGCILGYERLRSAITSSSPSMLRCSINVNC
jgi:hypothetical protein